MLDVNYEENRDPIYQTVNDPEFYNSYVLVPRASHEGQEPADVTSSPAAVVRAPWGIQMELKVPKTRPDNVLQRIGLVDYEKMRYAGGPQQLRALAGGTQRGIFGRFYSLGMAAAYFRQEKERDDARTELDQDYEFVPNFPLTIPVRQRLGDVPDTRSHTTLAEPQWPAECGIAEAHRRGIRGAGVLVGVLDTGVDADHQEFSHQIVPFRYVPLFPNDVPPRDIRGFDTDGHGSHVSGIACGRTVGIAPEANLYVASVIESETTRTSLIRLTSGLEWLLTQFRRPENERRPAVVNMSLGFPPTPPPGVNVAEYNARFQIMKTLLGTLIKNNALPVIAIGNDGAGRFRVPGAFEGVLAVGASDFSRKLASFSGSTPKTYGVRKPDLIGYGVGIHSSVERDFPGRSVYQNFSGTSMATPYVSGVAALYRCRKPSATVDNIWQELVNATLPVSGDKSATGAGLAIFK